MFSPIDSEGIRDSSWWTVTTPEAKASCGEAKLAGLPPTRRVPSEGWTTPARIFTRVDLPDPFLPIRACTLPGAKSWLKRESASVGP